MTSGYVQRYLKIGSVEVSEKKNEGISTLNTTYTHSMKGIEEKEVRKMGGEVYGGY